MASPGNRHCANCIGALLFPMHWRHSNNDVITVAAATEAYAETSATYGHTPWAGAVFVAPKALGSSAVSESTERWRRGRCRGTRLYRAFRRISYIRIYIIINVGVWISNDWFQLDIILCIEKVHVSQNKYQIVKKWKVNKLQKNLHFCSCNRSHRMNFRWNLEYLWNRDVRVDPSDGVRSVGGSVHVDAQPAAVNHPTRRSSRLQRTNRSLPPCDQGEWSEGNGLQQCLLACKLSRPHI